MKEISGRKFMVVAFTSTYCVVIVGLVILSIIGKVSVETLLAAFAGFATMVALQNEWYFKREDRETQPKGETR
jgi:Na+-driven multidrug efflux pump